MIRISGNFSAAILAGGLTLATLASAADASNGFSVLYTFMGGKDGANPQSTLIKDGSGTLYGTTGAGGTGCSGAGCGTVFKLTSGGAKTVLYAFARRGDGADPVARLMMDKAGNIFGTTYVGGMGCHSFHGCGTVFRHDQGGTQTVLYLFSPRRGINPTGAVLEDNGGYLVGNVHEGGPHGAGAIYRLAPDGTEKILHAFASGGDGAYPGGDLIADKAGNFYGTTYSGGDVECAVFHCGTVFKLSPDGTETILHVFDAAGDGENPDGGLLADVAGNFYGTTASGGANGSGTVVKLAANGTESVLYSFTGGRDGSEPFSTLIADASGSLYGTTYRGGNDDLGVVFKLAPDGTESVLHVFTGGSDGAYPSPGLIADKKGNLYGTASMGGIPCGCGVVFKLKE